MVRPPLTRSELERGEHFGALLRQARGERSMATIAMAAGLSAETLRKIETGRAPTPSFFTVAAIAAVLGLSLDELARPASADHGVDRDGTPAPLAA
jgi:transcriptional regulator with XRE-family HTH domain